MFRVFAGLMVVVLISREAECIPSAHLSRSAAPCYLQCPHEQCASQCEVDHGSWTGLDLECFTACNPDCMKEKCPSDSRRKRALPPCYLQCPHDDCASQCEVDHGTWTGLDLECFTACNPDCMQEKCSSDSRRKRALPPCYLQCPHDECESQCEVDHGSWTGLDVDCFTQCNPDCMQEKCSE